MEDVELNAEHLSYTKDEIIKTLIAVLELFDDVPKFFILLYELNEFFHS